MVDEWIGEISNKFPRVSINEYVIMPNHIHMVISLGQTHRSAPTGMDLDGVGANLCVRPELGRVIQWFKTMSTNEYASHVKHDDWPMFDHRLWQRNYWERIIRDEKEYFRIGKYIQDNPDNWNTDGLFEPQQKPRRTPGLM